VVATNILLTLATHL